MLAVCTYSLVKCGVPEILDVMANHAFALIRRGGAWQIIESAERKRAEETLRNSLHRLNRAEAIAHLGSWELDVLTNRLSWSDEVYRIFGLQPQEFNATYEAFLEAVHPDDRAAVNAAYRGSLREGKASYEIEHRVLRRSTGQVRWVHERCEHIADASGRIIRSVGMVLDITERKRAEEALRESERRERERAAELGTLLDALPTAVFIAHDPDCLHITGNRAADELLRNPRGAEASLTARSEARPRHFTAIKDGRELRNDELPAQRAARGFPVQDFEFGLAFDDGTMRHVVGYGTPLQDAAGRPRGAVHVLVDITERRQAEQALLEAERARARLAETLTSEIAHRTKNNLAIVGGLLQLQMDRESASRFQADVIQDAVTRIMSFAALHEQMYQRRSEKVELLDALQRIADVDRQTLSADDVAISVEGPPAEYPSTTATNLCVVANELLTNALKHSPSQGDGRRIEVRLVREGGKLLISVWNSGNSVAADFDARAQGKTGLGLVHAIVEAQYGGSFTLSLHRGGTLARIALDEERLNKG